MGLMDDIEAAAANEASGARLRRRLGAAIAALGVLMCLGASVKSDWRVMEYGGGGVRGSTEFDARVGPWKAELCLEGVECWPLPRREMVEMMSALSRSDEAAIETWLDQRWRAGAALLAAALAGAVLVGFSVAPMRRRRTRTVAFAAGVIATIAGILLWRYLFADAVAFMSLGTGAALALAGVGDLILSVALVGISRDGDPPELARAVARARPGD